MEKGCGESDGTHEDGRECVGPDCHDSWSESCLF